MNQVKQVLLKLYYVENIVKGKNLYKMQKTHAAFILFWQIALKVLKIQKHKPNWIATKIKKNTRKFNDFKESKAA